MQCFGQAAIARFTMAEQVLDDMKRMLNFRTKAGLQVLQLFCQSTLFFMRLAPRGGARYRSRPGSGRAASASSWRRIQGCRSSFALSMTDGGDIELSQAGPQQGTVPVE